MVAEIEPRDISLDKEEKFALLIWMEICGLGEMAAV